MVLLIAGIASCIAEEDLFADGAAPKLVASVSNGMFTLENTGTQPMDVGGLRVLVLDGNRGSTVAKLPYTKILRPEPFIFTKGVLGDTYKITVPCSANVGDKIIVTNGVGIYARCIAQ
jgi:hypothetical protein